MISPSIITRRTGYSADRERRAARRAARRSPKVVPFQFDSAIGAAAFTFRLHERSFTAKIVQSTAQCPRSSR